MNDLSKAAEAHVRRHRAESPQPKTPEADANPKAETVFVRMTVHQMVELRDGLDRMVKDSGTREGDVHARIFTLASNIGGACQDVHTQTWGDGSNAPLTPEMLTEWAQELRTLGEEKARAFESVQRAKAMRAALDDVRMSASINGERWPGAVDGARWPHPEGVD